MKVFLYALLTIFVIFVLLVGIFLFVAISSEGNWYPSDRDVAFTKKFQDAISDADTTLNLSQLPEGSIDKICFLAGYNKPSVALKRFGINASDYPNINGDSYVLEHFWAIAFVSADTINIYTLYNQDVRAPLNQKFYSKCLDEASGYEIPIDPNWEKLRRDMK